MNEAIEDKCMNEACTRVRHVFSRWQVVHHSFASSPTRSPHRWHSWAELSEWYLQAWRHCHAPT